MRRLAVAICPALVLSLAPLPTAAQQLEPRAYSASPIGVTFLVFAGGRSQGAVLTDPSIAVQDVSATVDTLALGFGRTFALAGRQALFIGALPIAFLEASGRIGEDRGSVTRSGLADPLLKLSVGLIGAPALTPAAFVRAPRRAVVGASFSVVPPIGQYDRQRLINLGTNRWSFKPEVGVSVPMRRWTFDAYAGVWLYTTNDAFFPGSLRRTQDSMVSLQTHVSYEVGRHAWAALDGTWYAGGASTLNGVRNDDRQRNTRVGGTVSIPIQRRYSIKVAYSTGATTRVGSDFNTFLVSWQMTVF
jgi:hypothetical protein